MKRIFALFLLLILPLCASSQQRINRNVAGLTLGKYYTIARAQKNIENKYHYFSRLFRDSNKNTLIMLGSIPFAGENWECLSIVQESAGKIAEITFGNDYNSLDDAKAFFLKVCEIVVAKYGKPQMNSQDDAFECLWEDNNHTQLHLQVIPGTSSDGSAIWDVWLSYEDESLVRKIKSDIINEL